MNAHPSMNSMRRPNPSGLPHIVIRGVSKSFDRTRACADVSLQLARGEFVTLLGDSGCGKTTLLRIAAGFVRPDAGRVLRDDSDITNVPPASRRMGFVFQSYALFPTKTVEQNIAFPLSSRDTAARSRRVRELAALVEIGHLLDRYPHELSGGQQQRTALARALASDPEVLLLDEPMSALDARIRAKLRMELRAIVDNLGITTLYVTHDQEEALVLSDRVAVMRGGRIEQIGTPDEIYHRPKTLFVGRFVGSSNAIEGRMGINGVESSGETWQASGDMPHGSPVTLLVRQEHIAVRGPDQPGFPGRVESASLLGATRRLGVRLASGRTIIADCPSTEVRWARGDAVTITYEARSAMIFARDAR